MSEMTEAELQGLRERWEAIQAAMENTWDAMDAIAKMLPPVYEGIKQLVLYLAELVQRAYLYELLPSWMPKIIRSWLARHWPRALLPELAEAIEWMKAEAAQ